MKKIRRRWGWDPVLSSGSVTDMTDPSEKFEKSLRIGRARVLDGIKSIISSRHLSYNLAVCMCVFLSMTGEIVNAAELDIRGSKCPHPSVPYASTYQNISGGPGDTSGSWKIKYICDKGYELFGDDIRECRDGRWPKSSLPICSVNVANHKPATSSSVVNLGHAGNAVDGKSSTVHEGKVNAHFWYYEINGFIQIFITLNQI